MDLNDYLTKGAINSGRQEIRDRFTTADSIEDLRLILAQLNER